MADDWQSQNFRTSVIAKINEMLKTTGQDPSKNASVMENHIFKKSRNKDEYLGLVAKLYMHFKDLSQRKPQQPPPPNAEMGQQSMMQDPLNALQNLASQGNRNPQMMPMPGPNTNQMTGGPVAASNLLQTLNQQRPGQQQIQQMQSIRGQMPMGPGAGVPNVVGPGQMVPTMGGGMQIMGGAQQQPQMGNAPQMSGMPGQMNQLNAAGAGSASSGGAGGPSGPGSGAANHMQMNANQMQGGPMNVSGMNVQQMQQMNPNQMAINMNHPQLNQMMNARMNQSGPMNVGPNTAPQGMQGIPQNMQQSMQQNQGGPIHPNNVVVGPQGQQVGGAGPGPGNINQMLNMPPNMQQKGNMPMTQGGQMFNVQVNRGVGGQQQYIRQSPSPCASPAGMGTAQQQQLQQQQIQQQQTGPPQPQPPQLPNPQMIPSPALVPTSSPQMSNLMQNNQRNLRQSPSAPLNTPGQVASISPFNPQEDQLYREKYNQLKKYIEPLKRMVAKIGNDGTNVEKITKINKLLEILCNPTQRVPLETLLKCEKALEKMEIVSYTGHQFAGKTSNALMEVINTTLQSPIANHTLYRTFRPSLELLFGTDICAPTPPKVQRIVEKPTQFEQEIPHVLQGEIARLDQKFKVTLDTISQNNTKSIKLICCLDDKRLPSVPPVNVNIPEDYPSASPDCSLTEQDYSTPFLKIVQESLVARIAKLPKCYSLSHLLDTWEMAVRQACSPNAKPICDLPAIISIN